ncbi:hypothetical protein D3C78_1721570 [compost metagenome]
MAAQLAQQFDAVDTAELAIGDHQVGKAPLAARQRLAAVGHLHHAGVAAHVQHQLGEQLRRPGIGLGDQDFRNLGGRHGYLEWWISRP